MRVSVPPKNRLTFSILWDYGNSFYYFSKIIFLWKISLNFLKNLFFHENVDSITEEFPLQNTTKRQELLNWKSADFNFWAIHFKLVSCAPYTKHHIRSFVIKSRNFFLYNRQRLVWYRMPVMKMRTALNIKRLAKYTQELKIVIVIV